MKASRDVQDNNAPPVVLYVSDDTSFLNTVRRNLGHTGFSVVTTRSAADAIELTSESQFDAILSDYDLPQMDALTLLEQISHKINDQTPPMLVISDHRTAPLRSRCLAAGTAGLHAKTESVELLIERVTAILQNEKKRERILRSAARRRFEGSTDPLTQVATKQHFIRRLRGESVAAYRDQTHLSLLMVEMDRFEKIIDQFGKTKADGVLAQVARLIEGELRSRDCVARYADQTFAVILPDTNVQAASAVGRRLRRRLGTSEFGDVDMPISLTVSVGAANRPAGMQTPPDEIISLAIHASQAAQKMGGDRVLADNALTGCPLILVVGDPAGESGAVSRTLEDVNAEVRIATSQEEMRAVLEKIPVAMVIADDDMAGPQSGVDLLAWVRNRFPSIRRVLIATGADNDLMMRAVNRAAIHYFIPVPWNLSALPNAVDELLFS